MAYQVMHAKQVESKKSVLAAVAQVDDMYDMLAAYEQKVPYQDAVKHDDLREAATTFVTELTSGKEFMADHKEGQMESLAANIARTHEELAAINASLNKGAWIGLGWVGLGIGWVGLRFASLLPYWWQGTVAGWSWPPIQSRHPRAGDYVNPDADAESVLADVEGVLSQLRDLSTACDTYKEYQVRDGACPGPCLPHPATLPPHSAHLALLSLSSPPLHHSRPFYHLP